MLRFLRCVLLMVVMGFSVPIIHLERQLEVVVGEGIAQVVEAPKTLPMKPNQEVDEEELHCLALALFKEVRGEPLNGQIVVAETILNRTRHKDFPNTVCKVVKQKIRGNCMFSFWCHSQREKVTDIKSYNKMHKIAYDALLGKYKGASTSYYFKRCDVESGFFNKLEFRGKIGNHCFFR